ncbi:hypothetical protein AAMO2058_001677800 [Amorphochlora amoebiformis]
MILAFFYFLSILFSSCCPSLDLLLFRSRRSSVPIQTLIRSDPDAHPFRSRRSSVPIQTLIRSDPDAHPFRSRRSSVPIQTLIRSDPDAHPFRSRRSSVRSRSSTNSIARTFQSGHQAVSLAAGHIEDVKLSNLHKTNQYLRRAAATTSM